MKIMLKSLESEFDILRKIPVEEIRKEEAILSLRYPEIKNRTGEKSRI